MNERIYCVKRPASWSPFTIGKVYFMKIRQTLGGEVADIANNEKETTCLGMHQVVECFILIDRIAKREIQDQFDPFVSFPVSQFVEDLQAITLFFDWYIIGDGLGANVLHFQNSERTRVYGCIDITEEKYAQKGTKRYKELLDNISDCFTF